MTAPDGYSAEEWASIQANYSVSVGLMEDDWQTGPLPEGGEGAVIDGLAPWMNEPMRATWRDGRWWSCGRPVGKTTASLRWRWVTKPAEAQETQDEFEGDYHVTAKTGPTLTTGRLECLRDRRPARAVRRAGGNR